MDRDIVTPELEALEMEEDEAEEKIDETEETVDIPAAKEPSIASRDFVKLFSEPLFLAANILMTVYVAIGFDGREDRGAASLFSVLFLAGLWVIYIKARSGKFPIAGMKYFKGVLIAYYVVRYVLCALMIVMGVMMITLNITSGLNFETILNDGIPRGIYSRLADGYYEYVSKLVNIGVNDAVVHNVMFVTAGSAFIFAALVLFVVNVIFTRHEVTFVGSLCKNAENGECEILCARAVRLWMFVFGIFSAVGAVVSGNYLLLGTYSAYAICTSLWIKKIQ